MKLPGLLFMALTALSVHAAADLSRWQQHARNVTITRDLWGIPHIHGQTDADAVFGFLYAQAEDDFPRIELNYLNSLGRLAEVEGEPRCTATCGCGSSSTKPTCAGTTPRVRPGSVR